MPFLYFLEGLRNPFFDALFSFITLFGEETLFMAAGLIIFWCVNKYEGYYLLCTGFLGTVINQFLKMFFRIPRPWVKDPNFTIVESAREAAAGYSFPSGHTQVSVGLYGGICRWNKNNFLRSLTAILCILVPLSRLYLGVHTPLDVSVSIIIALIIIFGFYPLFKRAERSPKIMYAVLFTLTVIMAGYLCYICFNNFPADVYNEENIHNLISAKENGFTLLGCILGLIVVYTLDERFLRFDTKAVWWAQIIKAVLGIVLIFVLKEGLKYPLEAVFGTNLAARSIRYFLIVVGGGVFWPMTFKWFGKLGRR